MGKPAHLMTDKEKQASRAGSLRRYYERKAKEPEYLRQVWRAYYMRNRQARLQAAKRRYYANPAAWNNRARRRYQARIAAGYQPPPRGPVTEARRLAMKRYYWTHRDEILARKKAYDAREARCIVCEKLECGLNRYNVCQKCRRDQPDPGLACERCGERQTAHPSGLCHACRRTLCKKCGKPVRIEWRGQAYHLKCQPRE